MFTIGTATSSRSAKHGYSTDLIAAEFERVIALQSKDRPFFIYVPFNAVHGPIDVVPRHTDNYSTREAALKCYDEAVGRILESIDAKGFAAKHAGHLYQRQRRFDRRKQSTLSRHQEHDLRRRRASSLSDALARAHPSWAAATTP